MRLLSTLALALVALLSLPATPVVSAGSDSTVKYELFIDCPQTQGVTIGTGTSATGCPVRAVDSEDMMGDPSLAVDPMDPNNLILGSLHGGVDGGGAAGLNAAGCPSGGAGPTPKSRCGQVFTTFTSGDAGNFWTDNPYNPPEGVDPYSFGEHTQVTIDPYGHVFVGSLYAEPVGGNQFTYRIGAQKFDSLRTIDSQQSRSSGGYQLTWIDPVHSGGAIHGFWFLFNPATDNMTIVWNEVGGGAAKSGNSTQGGPRAPGLPALDAPVRRKGLWGDAPGAQELASEPEGDSTGLRSVIGIVWTGSNSNDSYYRQPVNEAIGPCSDSTNPVLSDGYLYIGCVADPKQGTFRWHPDTQPGTLELFRLDPDGGTPVYMGPAPIVGGSPKLGVRSDGRLALVSADATDGNLALVAVFGHYREGKNAIEWGSTTSFGTKISPAVPGVRITKANVQDLIYREQSGVIHLILRETFTGSGVGASTVAGIAAPHIRKSIVAIDEDRGLMAKFPLDIGNPLNRTDPTLLQAPEAAYEDLTDDFLQLPAGNFTYTDRTGKQHILGNDYSREFFAVGDYGTVIFAELIEVTDLRAPGIPPVPPAVIPLAAPATSATSMLVPSAGVAVAGLLAFTFVANRRKNPMAAFAKQKK